MSDNVRRLTLLLVVILVVGSITYLESSKAAPGSTTERGAIAVPTPDEVSTSTTGDGMTPKQLAGLGEPTTVDLNTTMLPNGKPVAEYAKERGIHTPIPLGAMEKAKKDSLYQKAREITGATGFLNTGGKPITIGGLLGKKVILVDFWTYSCINCQRTLPYVTSWYGKYKDQGLEIVSIHTPEFDFEKDPKNVAEAAQKFGVTYPIVQDNDYAIWHTYENRYWPHHYLIDIDGYVVEDHIGEGGYEETEASIQKLLKERSDRLGGTGSFTASDIVKPTNAVDLSNVGSPETYVGSARNERFGNGNPGVAYADDFTLPQTIDRNTLYLEGKWNIKEEYGETEGKASIVYRYKAKNVYLVMAPATTTPGTATIYLDGKPVGSVGGKDVVNGKVTIASDTLYHLVSHPGDAEEHVLKIVFDGPGTEAFAFTFG